MNLVKIQKKAQQDYNLEHTLRSTWSEEDKQRISNAMQEDGELDTITMEEIEAVNDMLYDRIAAQTQTHYGITTLQ